MPIFTGTFFCWFINLMKIAKSWTFVNNSPRINEYCKQLIFCKFGDWAPLQKIDCGNRLPHRCEYTVITPHHKMLFPRKNPEFESSQNFMHTKMKQFTVYLIPFQTPPVAEFYSWKIFLKIVLDEILKFWACKTKVAYSTHKCVNRIWEN